MATAESQLATGAQMQPGDVLNPGASINSPNQRFRFVYQTDGNLVLYGPTGALWHTHTGGKPAGRCTMQADGNLVVYDPAGTVLAAIKSGSPGSHLVVQDDGNVVIYRTNGKVAWETRTWVPIGPEASADTIRPGEVLFPGVSLLSANQLYRLSYQTDGNLVLYSPAGATWENLTGGSLAGICILRLDGSLAVYAPGGAVTKVIQTGHPGSHLVVQNDGNVVIYDSVSAAWSTNTWVPMGPVAAGDSMQPGEVLPPGAELISPNGTYNLRYQTDGNLEFHGPGGRMWASGTGGRKAGICILQQDGNLVVYEPGGKPVWATGTDGNPGIHLSVDDGNVYLYGEGAHTVWQAIPPE